MKRLLLYIDRFIFGETFAKKWEQLKSRKKVKVAHELIQDQLKTKTNLQIGTGAQAHAIPNWINTCISGKNNEVIFLDCTKPWPIPNNSLNTIYSEHVFEHLTHEQGLFYLSEAFRTLKPGGIIKTITPNLAHIISLYHTDALQDPLKKGYMEWSVKKWINYPTIQPEKHLSAYTINNFFYNWAHRFIYDKPLLQAVHESVGFTNITFEKPGSSQHAHLKNIESHQLVTGERFNEFESIALECQKPK